MRKKFVFPAIIISTLFVAIVGPWPVSNQTYENSLYSKRTLNGINKLTLSKIESNLRAGYAKRDITPPVGTPLAGYVARDPKENTGVYEPIFAKAITIQNQQTTITIVNSETLLPLPLLIEAILYKTGLTRDKLYFTSTHTHSGPGGFAKGIIEQQTIGEFSAEYFDYLSNKLAEVILESRFNLSDAILKYTNVQLEPELAESFIYNQLQDGPNGHNTLHLLQIINPENQTNIANIVTFSAHPTFFGRLNNKVSGDYPGVLTTGLEKLLGGLTIYIPGAVGGMIPLSNAHKPSKEPEESDIERHEFTSRLISTIEKALSKDNSIGKIQNQTIIKSDISSIITPITLPAPSYRISDSLRLSPFLVEYLFHNTNTYIHALKINDILLLGYPSDYSGELAAELESYAATKNISAWITCFNGDYIGYLSPSKYYAINHYITRDANIFGKYTGDYFNSISKSIIDKLN